MKTRTNVVLVVLALLAYFSGLGTASAFYDPGAQRWLNRDPIAESGFELVRGKKPSHKDDINLYKFVGNSPIQRIDVHGLGIKNYPQYGNYCGGSYCGGKVLKPCETCDFSVPPKDAMDSCCKDHDKCYDDAKGNTTKLHACDQNLCSCLKDNVDPSDFPTPGAMTMYNQLLIFACSIKSGGGL